MTPTPGSITTERVGDDHVLQAAIWLPRPIGEVFSFFADAGNLATLTPAFMNFRILTRSPIEMDVGTLIDYRIRVRGLPLRWRTQITAWDPPHRFEDVQLRGPYRLWEHTHTFEPSDGGTICRDRVRYRAPGGELVRRWCVAPDLQRIFEFRSRRLLELFPPDGSREIPAR